MPYKKTWWPILHTGSHSNVSNCTVSCQVSTISGSSLQKTDKQWKCCHMNKNKQKPRSQTPETKKITKKNIDAGGGRFFWVPVLTNAINLAETWRALRWGDPAATYCWRNPIHSPVQVCSWNPIIYKVLYIPGGCLGFLPSTMFTNQKFIELWTISVKSRFPQLLFWNKVVWPWGKCLRPEWSGHFGGNISISSGAVQRLNLSCHIKLYLRRLKKNANLYS